MTEIKGERKRYYIPDNFIEEGRILSGRIKVRNLIEAVVLTAAVALLPLLLILSPSNGMTVQAKISLVILVCAPPLSAGIAGFNGDSLFDVLIHFKRWRDKKGVMLYNHRPRLLRQDPVDEYLSQPGRLDALIGKYEDSVRKRTEKKTENQYREGRDFVFEDDPGIDRYTSRKETEGNVKEVRKIHDISCENPGDIELF